MSAQQTQRLLEIALESGKSAESEPFLQNMLAAGVELTDSESAAILEYDSTVNDLHFLAVTWGDLHSLQPLEIPLEGSAAGWVIRTSQPLMMPEGMNDPRHFIEADRVNESKTRSLLAVPVLHHNQPIGVLEAFNKAGNAHYTEEDVTVLETLAGLIAEFVRNDILERLLLTTYHEIAELDRLKNDFIGITSHELRTPLGLIIGHATFLLESVAQEYHEQIDAILRNATRLKDIIENLSSVDNYQAGVARLRQRKISMTRIIEDVAASFQEMAKQKEITLKVDIPGKNFPTGPTNEQTNGELMIEADAGKIAIALSNLVKNALIFTDNGGQVIIHAEKEPGSVKVSVIDNGVGIPPKDLPLIFERFFQVESHLTRRHGGMGLGLSVAKVMIEMHGGRIWAESEEGKGSNFTFLLPIDRAQVNAGIPAMST
jgi:signal transduction histidine kinase